MQARACKIVATMGPASDAPERILMLIEAGVNCFRLNFSHGSHEQHAKRFAAIREAEKRAGRPIAILADLQGPKIRVGSFVGGVTELRYGQIVTLEASDALGEGDIIRLPHAELLASLEPGDILKLDDGKMQITVTERASAKVMAKVDFGGKLTDNKGLNVPTRRIPISALTEKDKDDLVFALAQGADYIALSFVQTADDIREARAMIGDRAGILAKIEKPSALSEIEEIIALCDAIMVARGDLGVELPPEQVPIAQRRLVRAARNAGKPVIVATHMLESMIDAPTPTRAEASDVATAVYQGADAVMLSAESAVGRHPATAVAIMDRIIRAVEADDSHWSGLLSDHATPEPTTADAISLSARETAAVLNCATVAAYTSTGSTALRISRERPRCGVMGLSPLLSTARRLCIAWGVRSVVTPDATQLEEMVDAAVATARKLDVAKTDDRIVVVAGIPPGRAGKTNTIRIVRLD